MKIVRGMRRATRLARPVVAIGVFDGMHLGHTAILRQAVRAARAARGTSVVVTFWPDPHSQESIYSIGHRMRIMESLGIDVCVLIRFDTSFAGMSAEDFARGFLAGKLGAARVFVGSNFRFGSGLQGTAGQLKLFGARYGFTVRVFGLVRKNGTIVSSTNIRRLIARGALDKAASLLGRQVSVLGPVVHGRAVGRTLGARTANVVPDHEILPPDGVYAARASLAGKRFSVPARSYPAVCYIGRRPTFSPAAKKKHVEVHLFDFSGSLYGRRLEVVFLKRLRPEIKFPTPAALAAQISKDILAARAAFSRH